MKCPRCEQDNASYALFCLKCGAPVDGRTPIANSYADLKHEIEGLNGENDRLRRSLGEAVEQQTATAAILRVISESPTDVQPVFGAIVESARKLFNAHTSALYHRVGDQLHIGAFTATDDAATEFFRSGWPRPFASMMAERGPFARVFQNGETRHVEDFETDINEPEASKELARLRGYRAFLQVPMRRGHQVFGALSVSRRAPGFFTPSEVALLRTFADQAVIAIENVRLFNETKEALERQTASAEILRVIASSPTDLQPVLDAVAESAARVCTAEDAVVMRVEHDTIRPVARFGTIPPSPQFIGGRQLSPRYVVGRAILDRRTIHIANVGDMIEEFPEAVREFPTILAAPLVREGAAVGAIVMRRREVKPFTDKQIAMLQTFADQAVIAIENVRLFTELQQKNEALTQAHAQVSESLEQQTATAEILRVISRSPTDVQPVFEAIVESAVRLCGAARALAYRFDGEYQHLVAYSRDIGVEGLALLQRLYPRRPHPESATGLAILERAVIHIPDAYDDPRFTQTREVATTIAAASRSVLAVPMLHHGEAVGAILVYRGDEPRPFSPSEIDLLKTFADQAVIAIENVRLFRELEARTQDLTRSVSELRALGDVSRAISSTLDLHTVLTTIVSRAVELSNGSGGVIYEYDQVAAVFELRAAHNVDQEVMALQQSEPIRIGEGAVGRAVATRAPVQIGDLRETQHFAARARVRELLIARGYLSVLAVPLLVEDEILGALVVLRQEASELGEETVELMKTFATQSALAIQNARLFREIEQKSRELEAASRHKSEFLANMSHELRTPLNAIIGFSEVLGERMFGELNEKQEEYLKDIHTSGQHLLSLINDILDLSKIEAGRMELEVTDFDLPMTIENALMLVRERAGRRSIALHTTIDERLGQVQADERKIRQVLLNLLSNAIKFTPEGGRIYVEARSVNESIEVSVTDTGVGIAPEDQEAVFEEFRQVGIADKKVEGTGLGLALSRKFIELHGGKIWVKSQVGAGSTFTFTVPVRRDE